MKNISKGFTLIELMIVVAIIAILAAIAIPAYQDYVIRSQVSEGSALADGAKTALAEYRANYGIWPANNADAGLEAAGKIVGNYVKSVDASAGKIQVTFSKAAPQKAHTNIDTSILSFSAFSNLGSITWTCGAAAGTTVNVKYLPSSCR